MRSVSLRVFYALAIVTTMMVVLSTSIPAWAVHDIDLFELDGNAFDGGADGDDWSGVYAGSGSFDAHTFVADRQDTSTPPDTTYFTGGGSKDDLDIPNWRHTATDQAPDKDEILDAYAAAYDSGGDLVLYFGADRFANNGDAQIGFWFFQSPVSLEADGTFSGTHSIGDILVLSDFTNGGSISTIRVFQWVGSGGSEGTLDEIAVGADCSETPAGDPVCARVNTGSVASPWPFAPKSGTAGSFPAGSFYEGGVNLSAIDGFTEIDCLSGFLAETRSSQSVDAQLKDFALGSFDLCDVSVTKTGDALSKVGDPVNYTITVTNEGARTLYKDDITDSILGDIATNGVDEANSSVTSNTCGATLGSGASCSITLTYTVQSGDPDPLVNVASVLYRARANLTGVAVSATDDHSTNLFQPSVEVVKTADSSVGQVGDTINYTFTVNNLSSSDSPNLILDSIVDDVLGDLAATAPASCDSIAAGGSCTFDVAYTIQGSDPDPLTNTVTVHYHPSGFPNDITDTDSHSVNLFTAGLTIDKTGDEVSKAGDGVTYHYVITNNSSADSPDLVMDSVVDDRLGSLTAEIGRAHV